MDVRNTNNELIEVIIKNDVILFLQMNQGVDGETMKLNRIRFVLGYTDTLGETIDNISLPLDNSNTIESTKQNLILCEPYLNGQFIFNRLEISVNETQDYVTDKFDVSNITSGVVNQTNYATNYNTLLPITFIQQDYGTNVDKYIDFPSSSGSSSSDNFKVYFLEFDLSKLSIGALPNFQYNGSGSSANYQNSVTVKMLYDDDDDSTNENYTLKQNKIQFTLSMNTTGTIETNTSQNNQVVDTESSFQNSSNIEYGDIEKMFIDNVVMTPSLVAYTLANVGVSGTDFTLDLTGTTVQFDFNFPATYYPFYKTGSFETFTISTSNSKLLVLGKVDDVVVGYFGESSSTGQNVGVIGNAVNTTEGEIVLNNFTDGITVVPTQATLDMTNKTFQITSVIEFLTRQTTFDFIISTEINIVKLNGSSRSIPRKENITLTSSVTFNPLLPNVNIIIMSFISFFAVLVGMAIVSYMRMK